MDSTRRKGIKKQMVIPAVKDNHETFDERSATAKGVALAENKRYQESKAINDEITNIEKDLSIREGTSELLVITKTKKLAAYVVTITEKSPKKFRAVFVNRMQNYCLDALENLIEANSLRMDNVKNKERRKDCQHAAYLKFKLLSYISFLALENECILKNSMSRYRC